MPTGPKGENRPADSIDNVVHIMRIATGEVDDAQRRQGQGRAGGACRLRRCRVSSMRVPRRSLRRLCCETRLPGAALHHPGLRLLRMVRAENG